MVAPGERTAKAQGNRISEQGKNLDYEQEALDGIQRSWELEDKECMKIALLDAQAWAILHLARVVKHASLTSS
jgi:hypothetical protein